MPTTSPLRSTWSTRATSFIRSTACASTGKIGHTNIGLFAIDDREPGQTVAPGDPLYNKRAKFMVGRVSQDLGKGSSIGAIYTDEEFGQGWNRIGGVDFTWRMTDKWTALGQMVESSTKGTVDSGTPPTYAAGPASNLQLQHAGHAFNLQSTYQDISTGFQTQLGFIQTSNLRNGQTHMTYQWYPKHRAIQSYGLETNQNVAFDHQGNRVYHYSSFDPFILLPRNIVIAPHRRRELRHGGTAELPRTHRLQELHRKLRRVRRARRAVSATELQYHRPSAAAM